ncbi:magnesium/cobalt transporter CorA [Methylocystis sp. L43]|jgi:magnesium transporter|uniref:magnesium/cobalt transporter CorA n=1 Tax=unclassified Methylocystis TaxID=2625913 RepID=UPI0018C2FBF0|nr:MULTISPECIES: magnesium/cobalt transporter CorA [unclassified Methylocystis]MBG0798758.1 magnesium/cobalt transporter CorA [Methylocystis sp. L43]MBG0806265.1 magnesium/cobalt transporter CorA [Methylocystis sp. H15]
MDERASATKPTEAGVVAAAVYHTGRKIADIEIDEAGEWTKREGYVVWIGLYEPSQELLERVGEQFALHHLAIEDAFKAHQFPKLEEYEDSVFIVARTAQMVDGRIAFGETHIFIGAGYVVSVRHGASSSYAHVRERCEARAERLSEGEDFIVYAILDFIVDNYFPVLDAINDQVEDIEDHVLATTMGKPEIEQLYSLRRDLLHLRNAVTPLSDVCRRLERSDVVAIDREMRPHFRDVRDHLRRVQERIDTMRETLAFAFESSLMNAQIQQTDISRRLAAWAAILAVPTAIAGIYGMNFRHMPELDWKYGYYVVLGVTVSICGYLYYRLRRAGWL